MAGTINLSLSQQFSSLGLPLSQGQLYFYAAGTTTPQNAYQDINLSIPWPNPITLDSAGRVPQFFLADGQIKIRLTDKNGIVQITADNLLVVGPSAGGGGGGSVDPTTVLTTGDFKWRYGTGPLTGFVRANSKTIGSSTSGASERANADTQALFLFLYSNDSSLVVAPGGRGSSGLADYAANKTIQLPNARNSSLAGLADMGNVDSGVFANNQFSKGGPTVLGSQLGATTYTLLTKNLPPYTPTGSVATGLTNNFTLGSADGSSLSPSSSNPSAVPWKSPSGTPSSALGVSSTFTGVAQGGSSAFFETVSPLLLATLYLKL